MGVIAALSWIAAAASSVVDEAPQWIDPAAQVGTAGVLVVMLRLFYTGAVVPRSVAEREAAWARRAEEMAALVEQAHRREAEAARREDTAWSIAQEAMRRGIDPTPKG